MNTLLQSNVINLNNNPILELKLLREQIKALQEQEDLLKNKINNLLDSNQCEEMIIDDVKVKRVLQERSSFDSKSFSSIYPELYNQYKKSSAYIVLKIV